MEVKGAEREVPVLQGDLFKGLKKRIRGELNDDIVTAFLDVADVDMQKGTISGFESSDLASRESAEKIIVSCRRMKSCRTKRELLFILGEEVMQYSLKDPGACPTSEDHN